MRDATVETTSLPNVFFCIHPPPGLLPVLGQLERYMTPTLNAALLISSRVAKLPGILQFELRQSLSASEQLTHHTKTGYDPPSAEVQNSPELEFDAFTLQATTAGLPKWLDMCNFQHPRSLRAS